MQIVPNSLHQLTVFPTGSRFKKCDAWHLYAGAERLSTISSCGSIIRANVPGNTSRSSLVHSPRLAPTSINPLGRNPPHSNVFEKGLDVANWTAW